MCCLKKAVSASVGKLGAIVELALGNGFMQRCTVGGLESLRIGPTGLLLLENLKREWFYNTVFNKDVIIFLDNGNSSETYEFAKGTCSETLPFGIAEIVEDCKIEDSNENDFRNLLNKKEMKLLKCTIFQQPSNSTQFFHQWQRQRRMWWRKFSADPGKYALTDIKNINENDLSVEIYAKYPWGQQTIETIMLDHLDKHYSTSQLHFKQGWTQVQAHTVTSTIALPVMFLNTICDVYDEESKLHDKSRTLLRFHRKLAPYQIAMSLTASNAAGISELKDLAEYVTRLLRTSHVSTFYVPDSYKNSLESQYKRHDQLGVPYTVVLNEKTLVNGICYLRSRDTTLKEQVHVANLVSYVEQLFKNY